jgi:uncharacterized delta-60 repeat protein
MEMAMKKIFMMLAAVLILTVTGCGSSGSDSIPVSTSSAKAITGFSLNGCFGIINETNKTIAVTVPPDADLTKLVATFTTTGASVKVNNSTVQSGSTVDFSNTDHQLTFTVTAADASTKDYTVTVTVSLLTSGFLDADPVTGFGADHTGKVTTSIGGINDQAYAIGFQSGGKIVVAGSSQNGSNYNFALVRYNTDGIIDTTFGTNGIVTTSIGGINDQAYALVIQPDDTILVAGKSSINSSGTEFNFALAKYNADGTLDNDPTTGFGADHTGKVTTSIGGTDDEAYALGIQSDGSIVVAGTSQNGSNYNFALVRYNANGTIDADPVTGFGAAHTGIVTTSIGTNHDFATDLVILSGDNLDKILVAGRSSYNSNGSVFNFALVRYNANGTIDADPVTGFGVAHTGIVTTQIGIITTPTGIIDDQGHALGIQSDGKIVVAGNSYDDSSIRYNFALVRYNANGTIDADPVTGFGAAHTGIVTTPFGNGNNFALALGIQKSDDSILVAGSSFNSSNYDFALLRYTKNGSLDTIFGTGGIATTSIGSGIDYAYALGIQSDGKIVLAGTSQNGSNFNFALARYWP